MKQTLFNIRSYRPICPVIQGHILPALYLIATSLSCVVLSGCAQATLSHQAMALNKTVHNHRVDQLLLNVVRASFHEPMAMTTIGGFVQRNTDTKRASIDFDFGYLSSDLYKASASGEYRQSPEMTMTILDNQKAFIDGFMKPIDLETIVFFIKQGHDLKFLTYLAVEAIEVPISQYAPEDQDRMRERYPSRTRRNADGMEFIRVPNDPDSPDPYFDDLIRSNSDQTEIRESIVYDRDSGGAGRLVEKFVIPGKMAELVIRSPHGVLTYLGELARMSTSRSGKANIPKIDGKPVFLVNRQPKNPDKSQVSVLHRGFFYTIPNFPDNHSMAALNIVQQLIDLQEKEIDQNPSSIRLIAN